MSENRTNCSVFRMYRALNPTITSSREILVVIAVLLCLIAVFTLLFNSLIITAILWSSFSGGRRTAKRFGEVRLRSSGTVRLLMASMALADAVVAAVIMPVRIAEIVHNGQWVFPISMCRFRSLCSIYLCTVSIYHVMGMAVDRYLAVCRPMFHRLLTIKAGCLMAGFFWTFPLIICVVPLIWDWIVLVQAEKDCVNYGYCWTKMRGLFSLVGAIVTFYIPFTVIFILYLKILLEIRNVHKGTYKLFSKSKNINKIKQIEVHPHSITDSVDLPNPKSENKVTIKLFRKAKEFSAVDKTNCVTVDKYNMRTETLRKSGARNKNTKALVTIGLIVMTFTVSWLPFSVFKVVFGFTEQIVFPLWVYNVTLWMGYFNSTLNPLLFCLHRGVRSAVKKLLFAKPET